MSKFIVRFNTQIDLAVTIEADDDMDADEKAWTIAEEYLKTVFGNHRDVIADASLDGIGSYETVPLDEAESEQAK